jgi:hypothetical protein
MPPRMDSGICQRTRPTNWRRSARARSHRQATAPAAITMPGGITADHGSFPAAPARVPAALLSEIEFKGANGLSANATRIASVPGTG